MSASPRQHKMILLQFIWPEGFSRWGGGGGGGGRPGSPHEHCRVLSVDMCHLPADMMKAILLCRSLSVSV